MIKQTPGDCPNEGVNCPDEGVNCSSKWLQYGDTKTGSANDNQHALGKKSIRLRIKKMKEVISRERKA